MKLTPHAFTDIAIKDNVSFKLQIIELEFSIKFQIFVSFYAFLIFRSTDFRDGDIFCKLHSFECKIFVRNNVSCLKGYCFSYSEDFSQSLPKFATEYKIYNGINRSICMRDPKEEERNGCWESAILWETKDAYQMVYMGESQQKENRTTMETNNLNILWFCALILSCVSLLPSGLLFRSERPIITYTCRSQQNQRE